MQLAVRRQPRRRVPERLIHASVETDMRLRAVRRVLLCDLRQEPRRACGALRTCWNTTTKEHRLTMSVAARPVYAHIRGPGHHGSPGYRREAPGEIHAPTRSPNEYSLEKNLPFQQIQHRTDTVDCQPVDENGIVVLVTGALLVSFC
jgi:hypothetical protein